MESISSHGFKKDNIQLSDHLNGAAVGLEWRHFLPFQSQKKVGMELARAVAIVGATVCSGLALSTLFRRGVEKEAALDGHIGRSLKAVPDVDAGISPQAVFPGSPLDLTIFPHTLFSDSDGPDLTFEIKQQGGEDGQSLELV